VNTFEADVPAGVAIVGEEVTLTDGTTFFVEDKVKAATPERPQRHSAVNTI
jgi:hypothetical protein